MRGRLLRPCVGKSGEGRPQPCSTFRSSCALVAGCLFVFLAFAPRSHAQVSAAISGRVTDPAGAVVSGATVTAHNSETRAVRTTVTDEAGRYSILSLAVRAYEVRILKQGFQEAIRGGIHLAVGQEAVVEMTLRLRRYFGTRGGAASKGPPAKWQEL